MKAPRNRRKVSRRLDEDYEPIPFVTDFRWYEQLEAAPSERVLDELTQQVIELERQFSDSNNSAERPWSIIGRLQSLRTR